MLQISLILFQSMNPILASAILPGWGELLTGRRTEARVFFIVEGSLWSSYVGFNYFGHKTMFSSHAFAASRAGANPLQRDENYYDIMEDFDSSDDYNLKVERDASYYYPNDPVGQQKYIAENAYSSDDSWSWDTLSSRIQYWERRKAGREDLRRASFVSGFLIIDRIVSVINVAVFTKTSNINLDSEPGKIGIYYKF
jgi:hypothetical protein